MLDPTTYNTRTTLSGKTLYYPGRPVEPLTADQTVMGGLQLNRNWWNYVPSKLGLFYRPDQIKLDTYELMLQTDETVASGVKFIILSIIGRLGEYTHKSKRIQSLVTESLAQMEGSLFFAAREILTAIPYGFSCTEIVWRPDPDGKVRLGSLHTLHPRSLLFILDTEDNSAHRNNLSLVLQWPFTSYQADLPLNKIILYSNEMEFGNFYGSSRLKPAFKNWFYKDAVLRGWMITLERYGTPLAIARVPNGAQKILLPNGQTGTNIEMALGILNQLKNGTSMAIDKETEIIIAEVQRALGADFDQALKYLNSMIYRALLLPTLIADHDKNGSYSLGQQHFDLFTMNLDYLLQDLCFNLIEQLIRPLVEINFGKQKDYGAFRYRAFQQDDIKLMSEVFINMVNAGVIDPRQQGDLDYMRRSIGIPEANEADGTYVPLPLQSPPPSSSLSFESSLSPSSPSSSELSPSPSSENTPKGTQVKRTQAGGIKALSYPIQPGSQFSLTSQWAKSGDLIGSR